MSDAWDKAKSAVEHATGAVFGDHGLLGDAQEQSYKASQYQYDPNNLALGGDVGYADREAGLFNAQGGQAGQRHTGTNIQDVGGGGGGSYRAPGAAFSANGFNGGVGAGGLSRIGMANSAVGGFAPDQSQSAGPNYLGNEQGSREQQMYGLNQAQANLQMARDAAMGKAPSVAENQLRYGNDLNNASIQSQAASARGPGAMAMAQMNSQAQMANGNQATNAQQAILRAQEMAANRAQLYGATDAYSNQSNALRGADQAIINSGRNFNIQKGQLANQGQQIDDSHQMGLYGMGLQYSNAGLQGRNNYQQLQANEKARIDAAETARERANIAAAQGQQDKLLGTIAAGGGLAKDAVAKVIPGGSMITGSGGNGSSGQSASSAQQAGGPADSQPFGGHEHGKGY